MSLGVRLLHIGMMSSHAKAAGRVAVLNRGCQSSTGCMVRHRLATPSLPYQLHVYQTRIDITLHNPFTELFFF